MDQLKNNWQIKLLSLLAAFLLWSYVMAFENPTQNMAIRDIELTLINNDQLEQRDLVITDMQPRYANVNVSGPRNSLSHLDNESIYAVVDVSNLQEGAEDVRISYEAPSGIMIESTSVDGTIVTAEKIIDREMEVTIDMQGELADDYTIANKSTSPEAVTIRGPRSQVNKVDRLVASVNIDNLTADQSRNVIIQALDQEGNPVEKVNLSLSSVNVAISVLKSKEVPLVVQTTGEVPSDIQVTRMQLSPNRIMVNGKSEDIDELEELQTTPIDLGSITKNTNTAVEIDYPEGIRPVYSGTEVQLSISVEKKERREFDFSWNEIAKENLPADLSVAATDDDQELKVIVRGFPSNLEGVGKEDISVTLNLHGVVAGDHKIVPQVQIPDDLELVGVRPSEYEVTVEEE